MNPPKVTDEDYINFIIATPRDVTATEAERVQPESKDAPAHDAFTRLLERLEPDAETLWQEARTQIDFQSGILVLDDSTLEKPYSEFNALVYRHWSGKQKAVVSGINLITLLCTDGVRCVPIDTASLIKTAMAKPRMTILRKCCSRLSSADLIRRLFVSTVGTRRF